MHEINQLHDLLMLDLERQKLDLLSQKKENLCYCLLKANSNLRSHFTLSRAYELCLACQYFI